MNDTLIWKKQVLSTTVLFVYIISDAIFNTFDVSSRLTRVMKTRYPRCELNRSKIKVYSSNGLDEIELKLQREL